MEDTLTFAESFKEQIGKMVDTAINKRASEIRRQYDKFVTDKQAEVLESIRHGITVNIEVNGRPLGQLKGMRHQQTEELLKLVALKHNVLIVGSAGTGKSHAVEQVAIALGRPFESMSFSPQTTKSDIAGYGDVNSNAVDTPFKRAYRDGGVFLADEIDAANPSVLVSINSAISNGQMSFPVDGMIKRHPDFVLIATANTFGHGADRMYVGRNQLDAATLDRFSVLDWKVDEKLEEYLVGEHEDAVKWLKVVRKYRDYAETNAIRVVVSPRTAIRGATMLASGMDRDVVLQIALLNASPKDQHMRIKEIFSEIFAD